MDIDALHSALVSLTLLPEELRSARAEIATADGQTPPGLSDSLEALELNLRIAKAALAVELGFEVCRCCWPPELLMADHAGRKLCPVSPPAQPLNSRARRNHGTLSSLSRA